MPVPGAAIGVGLWPRPSGAEPWRASCRDGSCAACWPAEKTWIFYGNLRRMSKIPAMKKAFEVLAAMEKEHVDILRRLLGMTLGVQNP
jgi:hypothetical protein